MSVLVERTTRQHHIHVHILVGRDRGRHLQHVQIYHTVYKEAGAVKYDLSINNIFREDSLALNKI